MFHTVPAFFSPPPHPSSCFLKSNLLDLSESKAGAKAAVLRGRRLAPFTAPLLVVVSLLLLSKSLLMAPVPASRSNTPPHLLQARKPDNQMY